MGWFMETSGNVADMKKVIALGRGWGGGKEVKSVASCWPWQGFRCLPRESQEATELVLSKGVI